MRRVSYLGLILLTTAFPLTGCGSGVGDVSGLVRHQGQPAVGGTITFYDESNGAKSSGIKEGGAYAVTGVAVGTAKIAIVMPMAIAVPGAPEIKSMSIPPKYADPELSDLRCKVAGGKQKHNVELD